MKILITGICGFIGSNLADKLSDHELIGIDNLHSGSESNLTTPAELHIADSGSINKLDIKADYIFHMGVYSSSPMYKDNPQLVSKAIKDFTEILEYARINKAKIILSSSSSLYAGNPTPYKEDMEIKVNDYYTEARYAMERLAELYWKLHGVETTCLRYFSVYGPKEEAKGKYANILTQFKWAMEKGERPVIYGDGTQTRDFTHVNDVVRANIEAMDNTGFNIQNVGTGIKTSFNQIVNLLNKELKTDILPIYKDVNISNYIQDTQSEKGLVAHIKLEEGIKLCQKKSKN